MAEKTKLNAYINTVLADEFRRVARLSYGPIGLSLSAAMLKFLEMDAEEQRVYIKRLLEAEEDGTMDTLVTSLKSKQSRTGGRDPSPNKR